ncbi:MAG: sulfite reductase subunit alpha [Planctomycetota bacterium]|nr:sulfite reductase subunit alpha [Planctomycetaceae bacterium]MDQ3332960.1 sulfite reductase subunit alpha [Planctomycetota bacterium]
MSQLIDPPPLSLIPESAPFTSEQRAWLNGFFAGWLGVGAEAPAGTAGGVAAEPLPRQAEETFPWHEPSLPLDERLALAEEKPLPRRLMAAMAQLDCGACGYVCKTYAEKIAAGEETCLTLCSPGGKETSKALKQLLKEAPSVGTEDSNAGTIAPSPTAIEGWSRQNPYQAMVLKVVNLNAPGSGKHTSHIELDLGDSGLEYAVGDSLGVVPTNCDELVETLIDRLAATGDEPVTVNRVSTTLRDALSTRCCLTDLPEELLNCLADAADEEEAAALRSLIDDDGPLNGCDVLDVLRLFPTAKPAPSALVATLSPLRPRLYSISSSPLAHPGQVHLTVGRVAWDHNGRTRKGVASTMFADRLIEGHKVGVFVQKSHGFTVPSDPATPMIMIGPGTGIAPFRAFLEEREASGATGRNWLFFGDRHEATDFLYRDQLEGWKATGLLTRMDLAFSRDGDGKVYVQDRMLQNGEELWRWLEDGASVFVCGDAKRMAIDVDRTLRGIVAEHGGRSLEAAKEYVDALAKSGHYLRDVY